MFCLVSKFYSSSSSKGEKTRIELLYSTGARVDQGYIHTFSTQVYLSIWFDTVLEVLNGGIVIFLFYNRSDINNSQYGI